MKGVPPISQQREASTTQIGSQSSSSRFDRRPDCFCERKTVMLRAKTLKNPGRQFYTCPLNKEDSANCKYFMWVDEWEDYLANESLRRVERKEGVKDDEMKTSVDNNYENDKFKRDVNSKLDMLVVDMKLIKYFVFACIVIQLLYMVVHK
ncbi:uncharacterized protein At4g04775-like [Trifolium pratense]|uniref:Uncharacterized protein n=2 Tax=Trifolium pratense TaxID=57577 RepID=A0ACB0I784_TRIPR|nr:uncharacterized protein At4g04775-like [Trifolium pratense]XP_045808945.1 uncharacterized protein At4g04775-like [Trifolium pratense]CAJ2627878.1 unnamed protein product [Trifolium pratense]